MYTVTELSKMFKTTRVTIYNKFKHKDIQEFVIVTKQGKKLLPEGFNKFQLIMSDSKVYNRNDEKPLQVNTSFNEAYINSLKEQIVEVKKDKDRLIDQLNVKEKQLLEKDEIIKTQTRLVEHSQLLLLESNKSRCIINSFNSTKGV